MIKSENISRMQIEADKYKNDIRDYGQRATNHNQHKLQIKSYKLYIRKYFHNYIKWEIFNPPPIGIHIGKMKI